MLITHKLITIRIPLDLYNFLKKKADNKRVPLSIILRDILFNEFDKQKKKD